ncbi:hypothetical protein [Pedobacter montanisoli]|uniref:Peptidase C39-like domain-containing protein n=1 Tax=Pedobacter montanisoli TaxID=2923277 RepID=A0ABS9ZZH2_9SPHI|nr:hypothetical protein [Pedobacter montanisoli]MCJ0743702.1 hypothetical protein [Pedobacter montanisoli]
MKKLLFSPIFVLLLISASFAPSHAQGVPADSLFVAYKQDSANNCASIALIKANLNAFGLNGIYKERIIDNNTREYLLRDSSKILLTNAELQLAREKFNADISPATTPYLKSIVDVSLICYAIMAKKFPHEFPVLAAPTFEENLAYISDVSFNVKYGTNLLGTGEYFFIPRGRYSGIRGKIGAIVWSPGHTVFANNRKCDMPGSSANFYKFTKSYLRFWGRMWIDPREPKSKP